jgi:hypothetical protein
LQEFWSSTEADYDVAGHAGNEAMRHFPAAIGDRIE